MVVNVVIVGGRVWKLPCFGWECHALSHNVKMQVNPIPSYKPIKWGNDIMSGLAMLWVYGVIKQ